VTFHSDTTPCRMTGVILHRDTTPCRMTRVTLHSDTTPCRMTGATLHRDTTPCKMTGVTLHSVQKEGRSGGGACAAPWDHHTDIGIGLLWGPTGGCFL